MQNHRVCVIGAGVIGSLYAGHLARVAEVSVLTRRDDQARRLDGRRPEDLRQVSVHCRGLRDRRPGRPPRCRSGDRRDQGDAARGCRGGPRRALPGRDRDDDPERARRRGDHARARRLAGDLRRDLHERRQARRRARRVRARHRDLAGTVRGHDDVRVRAAGRGVARRVGASRPGVPRPPSRRSGRS